MKLLLLDNVDKLGKVGDIVEVARGYARNFLIPRSLAVIASEKQVMHHEKKVKRLREKLEEEIKQKKDMAAKVAGMAIEISKKATKDGKLFGSVTRKDVSRALKDKGLAIEGYVLDVGKLPKKTGKFKLNLDFGYDVVEVLSIEVKGE